MELFIHDLRHSFRMFRSSPGFALTAVAALALGIGLNTAIFSVVNTVLLKPVPAPDPDRVVIFLATHSGGPSALASEVKFNLWRKQAGAFDSVSASRSRVLSLTGVEQPEQVHVNLVTSDYFRLFGLQVGQGRAFTPEEERPSAARVAILGYPFWKRAFGGDPAVIGRTILLEDEPYRVIGVMADGIQTEPPEPPDIWAPIPIDPNSTAELNYLQVVGRLKPNTTLAQANAQLKLTTEEFRRRYPGADSTVRGDVFNVQPLQRFLVKDVRLSLIILSAAVSLVLLIACANVANLLLVRASARSREVAIRIAVGASRSRVVRQLLAESVLLSAIGGILGLGVGIGGVRALLWLCPANIPRLAAQGTNISLDGRVLVFTALIAAATGIIFGLVPALQSSRTDLNTSLKDGGRSGTGASHNKARAVLVVVETGLALVLVIGAALLIRALVAVRSVEPGFDPHNVLTARARLMPRLAKTQSVQSLTEDIRRRLSALPGVEGVGLTRLLPMDGGFNSFPIVVAGRPLIGPLHGAARWMVVSPGYFEVLKIPLLRGRFFTDGDRSGSPQVAIVNQSLARELWPGGDPMADRIFIRQLGPGYDEPPRQVIGIVGDVRENGLSYDLQPAVFVPLAQLPEESAKAFSVSWVVRARAPSLFLNAAIRKELIQAPGGSPVTPVRAMEELVIRSTDRQDFNMLLMSIFGGSALLLASIGIYGLMAYSTSQRVQEMGVRMALGAAGADVRNMVIWQGMCLALAGAAAGIAAALSLTRFLASLLFGIPAWDPVAFIAAPSVLLGVALAAVWLPAQRASRIDPIRALRHE
jgi:putative ABC transport system permease protein